MDFSSIGGIPVSEGGVRKIDFSSVGGMPVASPAVSPSMLDNILFAAKATMTPKGIAASMAHPGVLESAARGVIQQPPIEQENRIQGVWNAAGRSLPMMAAIEMAGPAGGATAESLATSLGAGKIFAPIAKTIGSAVAQGGAGGASDLLQGMAGGKSAAEKLSESADLAKNVTALGIGVPAAISGGIGGAKLFGKGIAGAIEQSAKLMGGVSPAALENLRQYPDEVMAYAKKGMLPANSQGTIISVGKQTAMDLATKIKDAISNAAEGAGAKYDQMKRYLAESPEGTKGFNIFGKVANHIEDYLDKKVSLWRDPQMSDMAANQRKTFNFFYNGILREPEMSPNRLANWLEDITQNIRSKEIRGTPLSAHLSELKNAVIDSLPEEWSRHTGEYLQPSGWDIKGTRSEYRAAMQLQHDLKGLSQSDTPLAWIQRTLRNGGDKAGALQELAGSNPEVGKALAEIPKALSGGELAPKIGNLPRTGLLGAGLLGATKVMSGNAAAIPMVGLEAAGMSPRLSAEILSRGRNTIPPMLNAASELVPQAAAHTATVSLPALLKANILNPQKSPDYTDAIRALDLPSTMAGNHGKASLGDIARLLHQSGATPEEDEQMALNYLQANNPKRAK